MWKKKAAAENETFLEHKRMKKWVDMSSGKINFMLYARSLFITWGGKQYWTWSCFKETSDENIEVAKLLTVCWLDVRGKLKISALSPGVEYEIAYQVKLTESASGWELPVTLRLSLPDGTVRDRQVSILERPKGKWFELNVGNFLAEDSMGGEVGFDLLNHGGHWKTGLIIKGVAVRPKTDT